jgi:hypothetical protein
MLEAIFRNVLSLVFLLITSIGIAQIKKVAKDPFQTKSHVKDVSVNQINMLKNGVLLVRLKTKKKSIDALRKLGKEKQANKLESNQLELNQKIVNAFRNRFNFCPTIFFYSDYSNAVRTKSFNQIFFLNDSLQHDSSITLDQTEYFLIAEFSHIEQDSAKHFDHYYKAQGENGYEQRSQYYGGPNVGFPALVVKTDQFVQLKKPFPYYVKTQEFVIKRKPDGVVKKLNRKIQRFYRKKKL